MTNRERLSEPAIRLDGLRIWVKGYQFPESTDAWDGNWLRITARCSAPGARVVVSGALLDTVSFLRFHRELVAVYERLEGVATLESVEPEFRAEVQAVGRAGRIHLRVEITPDLRSQQHHFLLSIDQSYLPDTIRGCERVLGRYPPRNAAARGA